MPRGLPTGPCPTCSSTDSKLRPNPFFPNLSQCEECRSSHPEYAIIGITDIKTELKLKDKDLVGLKMKKEKKAAFLGGPDKRWYLLKDVEETAERVEREKEEEGKRKARVGEDIVRAKEEAAMEKRERVAKKERKKEKKLGKGAERERKNGASKKQDPGTGDEETNIGERSKAASATKGATAKRKRNDSSAAGGEMPRKKTRASVKF